MRRSRIAKGRDPLRNLAQCLPIFRRSDSVTGSQLRYRDQTFRSSSARVSRPFPVYRLLYEFSRCHSRDSFPILLNAIVYSLLLEDFASVETLEAASPR
jgi:hypothetical protein